VGPGYQRGKKEKKLKEKERGEKVARAAAGLVALLGPMRGPVGLLLLFLLFFFFYISAL
jgi:hypothetical protein